MKITGWVAAAAFCAASAAPAWASECASCAAPSSREIQSAVDSYLAPASADATLVGGPGSAGYDGGFWIRGGSFLMKINLTIQTRWEGFDWDDSDREASPGGDLSGFSLPRVTLKFSGDATCDVHYYAELEFGHHGGGEEGFSRVTKTFGFVPQDFTMQALYDNVFGQFGGSFDVDDYDAAAREAWIEYEAAPAFAFRMGLIKTAATRQLMTAPELQQFVDISLASAYIGNLMPGYTDRNRDYGVMVHGVLGCDGDLSYMFTVTNGDGPVHRNVIDGTTSDNLAYSGRVNWDFLGHIGYEEGAVRQSSCEWYGSVGAWAHYYADHFVERPYIKFANRLTWGVDLALGYGGWSFTAAYNSLTWDESDIGIDAEGTSWFAQLGYLFPDTAWELAVRYSQYTHEDDLLMSSELGATEWAAAVNFYIDGHSDKLTLDAALITAEDDGNLLGDVYAGYNPTGDSDAVLIRFQWQLAL
jgi:hypothetical protein